MIVLKADVYRPTEPGRYPVLLCRTPYDKTGPLYASDAPTMASRGYIVVVQDSRGRFESEGRTKWPSVGPAAQMSRSNSIDVMTLSKRV